MSWRPLGVPQAARPGKLSGCLIEDEPTSSIHSLGHLQQSAIALHSRGRGAEEPPISWPSEEMPRRRDNTSAFPLRAYTQPSMQA